MIWLRRHLVGFLGALTCLIFVAGLRDVATRGLVGPLVAPPVPRSVIDRDASLDVALVDEARAPLAGASVRVFALREGKAYFAGDRNTDARGHAALTGLPRGATWVLAYGAARERASSNLVLDAGRRELELVLRPARALDVVVVDEADQPIEGATLEVTSADPLPYAARTDSAGSARVDRLGPGPYRVRAWALGFEDVVRSGVVAGTTPLRVRLERPAAILATVTSASGEPAPNATVLISGPGLWPPESATTDARGVVRIGKLRPGAYDMKARLGVEVSRTELAIAVERGETKEVTLALLAGKTVHVEVTEGEGGPPIRDADVVLVEEGLSSFPLEGRTSAEGVVELGPIGRTRASVGAHANGFVARTISLPDEDTSVKIALVRGGALVGEVVDDRGYPIAGATLEVVGADADGMPIDETSTMTDFRAQRFEAGLAGPRLMLPAGELGVMPGDIPDLPHDPASLPPAGAAPPKLGEPWVTRADGTFRCDPVPPGRVSVIVRHPSYVEAVSETVTLRSGGEVSLHVVLHQGGWIEGRVLDEDRFPVSGARVELAALSGSLERVAYAAEDGTFTFASAPDEVRLSVARPETPYDIVTRVTVAVPDRDRAEVEIILPKPRDTARLRVTDDRGYPVDRAEIHVTSVDVKNPLWKTLFTDREGEATLADSVGLAARFVVTRPGNAPLVEVVDPIPRDLHLTMDEGIEGRGRVTARDGREHVEGVELTLFTSSGARHARTDANGDFSVPDLAPGRVRIVARHPEYADAETVAEVTGDRDHPADLGTLELLAAGEVEGEVVDADDRAVAGARVALDAVPTFLPMGPLPHGIVVTDRSGRFKLGGLPEGTVALEAYAADSGRGRAEGVVVRAARTTDRVKIVVSGGGPATRDPKGAGSVAVTLALRGSAVVVLLVAEGSEAEVAGVQPGDIVATVDGEAVHSLEGARRRLTGPLGEDVVLGLQRENAEEDAILRVHRERVRR